MAADTGPVTELVRIPLAVPFESFVSTFTSQLEPVLLAQAGIISIMTGVIVPTDDLDGAYAVSITQWENMEAHGAFLDSSAAKPFFETLGPLAKGPPAIEHYYLGRLDQTMLQSGFVQVSILDPRGSQSSRSKLLERHHNLAHGKKQIGVAGSCIEVKNQSALLLFSDENNFEMSGKLGDGFLTSFVTRTERTKQKKTPAGNMSANL